MLYEYLITLYKVLVGLLSAQRLIAIALCAFGVYVVWMVISLIFSFQRRFNSNCQGVINYLNANSQEQENSLTLAENIGKISSGFGNGWKKFRASNNGRPSDYINRNESLDVEINGGVLNQGKTLMRTYIIVATLVLYLFNLAYIGGETPLNFLTFAEASVLPFFFYLITKLFYFLNNSIRQKLYRIDIASFYELVDLLDLRFAKAAKYVEVVGDANIAVDEEVEEKTEEEQPEQEETAEEDQEEKPGDALAKYDVFKKKNIDVDKLVSETPQTNSTLPFIDVDSDYVIKDEGTKEKTTIKSQDDATSILGGMMQNTSGTKKGNSFIEIEKNVAEIDNEKLEQMKQDEEASAEEEPAAEEPVETETEPANEIAEPEETAAAETNDDKFIEVNENEVKEKADEERVASVVSGFKANRSALASGGVVIERNQPIAKRERPAVAPAQETPQEEYEDQQIERPDAIEDTNTIINTLKSVPGNYDNYTGAPVYNQGYGAAGYDYGNQNMYAGQMQGYGYTPEMPTYSPYQQTPYADGAYQGYNQTPYPAGAYQNSVAEQEAAEEEIVEEKPAKKKVVRTKENEPRPRNLKSKAKQDEEGEEDMANRGRPRKHEVSETMEIKDDKEFQEVLARAEKLMRKSEEGLSESQSKRIEKEIKVLMDAMNRYKEKK